MFIQNTVSIFLPKCAFSCTVTFLILIHLICVDNTPGNYSVHNSGQFKRFQCILPVLCLKPEFPIFT